MVARIEQDVRFQPVSGTDDAQRATRPLGVVVVLGGALLALAAFRLLDWYDTSARGPDSAGTATFSDLHDNADQLSGAGAATAYFDWLAWVLLLTMVCVGVAANLPIPPAEVLRVAGCIVGVLGIAATYFAIAQLHNAQVSAGGERHTAFYNSSWGLWLAFAGFAAGGIGALLGPRRATP
jgi:hypothetical protein